MRISFRVLVVFAVTFALAAALADVAVGAVGSDAPPALFLAVPLMLWIASFAGLKHGLAWARRPRVKRRQSLPDGASVATHA